MKNIITARRLYFRDSPVNSFNDSLTRLSTLFVSYFLRDRFCQLNEFSPIQFYNKLMPDEQYILENMDKKLPSFSELMNKRIEYFISKNKHINILWSGGVDSTGLLLGFMNLAPKDQLTIVLNDSSIKEYPKLYEKLVKEKYDIRINPIITPLYEKLDGIILSGWGADQLFGSHVFTEIPQDYDIDYVEGMNKRFELFGFGIRPRVQYLIAQSLEKYCKKVFNLPIKNFAMFMWLLNFCFRADHAKYDTFLSSDEPSLEEKTKETFYTYPDFHIWAIQNIERISSLNGFENPRNYKPDLKKYIFELNHDEEYFNTKGANNSWQRAYDEDYEKTIRILYVDDNEGGGGQIKLVKKIFNALPHESEEEFRKRIVLYCMKDSRIDT